MPKLDLTVTVSVIIALCAIISPLLTTFMNNRYQLKLRMMDAEKEHYQKTVIYQRRIFENYLRYSGKCITHANADALREYGEHYLVALMYAPEDIKVEMMYAHGLMSSCKWGEASKCYEKLAPMICAMLKTM